MSLKIRLLVLATGLLPGMAGCSTHQRPVQIDSPTQVRHVEQESPSSFTATKSTGEVISEDEFNSTESIDWAVMREPDQSPLDTDIPDFDVENAMRSPRPTLHIRPDTFHTECDGR